MADLNKLYKQAYSYGLYDILLSTKYPGRDLSDYYKNRRRFVDKTEFETVEEYDKRLFYEDLLEIK